MAVHIQIDDITPEISYSPATSEDTFDVPFPFFTNADLVVYVDGDLMVRDVDYTVTGAGLTGGGTVTLTVAVEDVVVLIVRDVPIERTTDFPAAGPLVINSLNTELDRIIAIAQQLEHSIERTIRLPENEAASDQRLPSIADRANKFIFWDADGDIGAAALVAGDALQVSSDALMFETRAAAVLGAAGIAVGITTIICNGYYAAHDCPQFKYKKTGAGTFPTGWTLVTTSHTYVEWHGAKGDDTAFDDTAWVAAVATAKPIRGMPGKTYKCADRLLCGNASQLIHLPKGCTIHYTGVAQALWFNNSGIRITGGGKIKGDWVAASGALESNYGIWVEQTATPGAGSNFGVPNVEITGIVIRDIEIEGFGDSGIWAEYLTNPMIRGNHIHDCGIRGILVAMASNARFLHNTVDAIGPGFISGAIKLSYGIAVTRGSGAVAFQRQSTSILVQGNTISRLLNLSSAIDSHGSQHMVVVGNHCSGFMIGVNSQDNDVLGKKLTVSGQVGTFTANETVTASGVTSAIYNQKVGSDLYVSDISGTFSTATTITGATSGATATIDVVGAETTLTGVATVFLNITGNNFTGNVGTGVDVTKPRGPALNADGASNDLLSPQVGILFVGNIVEECGFDPLSPGGAEFIDSGNSTEGNCGAIRMQHCLNSAVTGNTINGSRRFGILLADGAHGVTVSGNQIRGTQAVASNPSNAYDAYKVGVWAGRVNVADASLDPSCLAVGNQFYDGAGVYAFGSRSAYTGDKGIHQYGNNTWGSMLLLTATAGRAKNMHRALGDGPPVAAYYGGEVSNLNSTATLAVSANVLYSTPLILDKFKAWNRVGFEVTTGAAGNARFGIYRMGSDGLPGALVIDLGTVTTTALGLKEITPAPALNLEVGNYYFGIVFDATPTIRVLAPFSTFAVWSGTLAPGAAADLQFTRAFAYAALPDPFGTPTRAAANVPMMWLRHGV